MNTPQNYIDGPLHSLLGGYSGTAVSMALGDADIHIVGSTPEAAAEGYSRVAGCAPEMSLARRVILIAQAATYRCARLDSEPPDETRAAGRSLSHWWRTAGRDLNRHKPGL